LEEWVAQFDEDGGCDATDRQLEALIRQSLAAMDSEPVAYADPQAFENFEAGNARREWMWKNPGADLVALYRHAQPAPEYPETLPCPVLLEPGLRFGKGIKTSTMLAALSRRAVHESDMAALSPEERAEFQAGIEDVKALIAQPAPVAQCPYPCGWDTLNKLAIQDAAFVALALVSGEPATESIRRAAISNNDRLLKVISFCRDAMPNAEPVVTQKECQKCKGTGIADSGGVQPWGEPILIECDCRTEPAPVAQCVPLGDSPYDVPYSMPSNLRELIAEEIGILFSDDDAQSVWDVCRRAAMLAAAPQEVNHG
ncbi:hypothetical protein ACVSQ3_28505, partial [Klebsiella pneumoniae]